VRVLLTNRELVRRAGSELWVRDMALALRDRGHLPVVYSPRLGEVASELRRATIPVVDDLARLAEAPDVIHGQHHWTTMTALLALPGVPAVAVCHGWLPDAEAPPAFPRIRRYVAVDDLVRERLVAECGIPPARVVVLRNFVDLRRFPPRAALPARPTRALALGNAAGESTFLPALRAACAARGIALTAAGIASGNPSADPATLLADAHVVFAKARAALEAAAVGCYVVLCDAAGMGPPLLPADLDRLLALNLGVRLLTEPVTPEAVQRRLDLYDPGAVAVVRERVRAEATLDVAADRLLALYAEVIAEHAAAGPDDLAAELRAAGAYLARGPLHGSRELLQVELEQARVEAGVVMRAEAELERGRVELLRTRAEASAQATELAWMRDSPAWRWRARLLRLPGLGALARWRSRRARAQLVPPAQT
jgi:hypothetical protein